MVRTRDSHSLNRGSIPLTAAINFDYLYCFCFCYGACSEIEPIITAVIWGSCLSQNVTFSHLLFGRVLTAVSYWHGKNPLRKSKFVTVHVAIPKGRKSTLYGRFSAYSGYVFYASILNFNKQKSAIF